MTPNKSIKANFIQCCSYTTDRNLIGHTIANSNWTKKQLNGPEMPLKVALCSHDLLLSYRVATSDQRLCK